MSKQATLERRRAARLETERAVAARELRTRPPAGARRRGRGRRREPPSLAVSASGADPPRATTSTHLDGVTERRGVLGDPAAPITVTEFVDLQCPVCAAASREVLPQLIDGYVRTGRVKLQARTLHFLGPHSVTAARAAARPSARTGCGASSRRSTPARAPRTRAT